MSLDGQHVPDSVLRSWQDAEPPARLDRAVRLRAYRLLAQRRAAQEPSGSPYPAWLAALTGAIILAGLAAARYLPAAGVAWHLLQRDVGPVPVAGAWLALLGSNLLAALVALTLVVRRQTGGN